MKRMTLLSLSLSLPLAAAAPAAAHQIWLEQDARAARLYFGEFGDNLREASPGLLDKFGLPYGGRVHCDLQPANSKASRIAGLTNNDLTGPATRNTCAGSRIRSSIRCPVIPAG